MRTKNIQAIGMLMGSCFVASFAGAADYGVPAIPGEPPAGTPSALPTGPVPAPEPAPTAPPTDRGAVLGARRIREMAPSRLLNIDVEGSSAYVWRGTNIFGADQNTQAFSVFPSVTATMGPLSLGYWGAFQLSGDNKSALVDRGVGAENDFILKYSGWLNDKLTYSAMLTYWVYPFANEEAAGTATPMYIEPGAGISYLTGADLGLYVGYYRALQTVNEPASFVYINPSVGKTFRLRNGIGFAFDVSAGYKIFTDDPPTKDRALDLGLHVSAAIPFNNMYITPQLHAAYVTRDEAAVPNAGFSDSFVAWAGVHVGYDIGI
jgi:hypothetical protein